MARAKAQGKGMSRVPLPAGIPGGMADLSHQGVSMDPMSKQLGIGYGTVWNYVQRVKAGYRSGGVHRHGPEADGDTYE
jgi:hypothetical protein